MKTTKIIYVSIFSILIFISLSIGNYSAALILFFLMISVFKIINLKEEIKNDEDQFDNQLKQRHAAYHELYKSCMTLTEDLKAEREKSAQLKIKADKYDAAIEKERVRGREKYQRLYKGKRIPKDHKRFAKKHLGRKVDIVGVSVCYGVKNGYIAGYDFNSVILGVEKGGWLSTVESDVILKEYQGYVYVNIKNIKLIEE